MKAFIQLEWDKYKKNRVFITMILAYVLFLPSLLFKGKFLTELPAPLPSNNIFFEFPTVWDFLGYNGNWQAFFFFGFLGVYFITTEFTNKTLRQNIITGMSRKDFFVGKISFIVLLSIFATLYYTLVGYTIGVMHTEDASLSNAFAHGNIIFRYCLMVFSYMSFGMLMGIIIRKTGLALLSYFTYIIFLEPMWRWLVHVKLFSSKSAMFYPMNVVEDLTPLPLYKLIPEFMNGMQSELGLTLLTPTEASIAGVIWLTVFIAVGYYIFIKKDL